MSFWKKSDDPWDWKDEEERRPREAPAQPPGGESAQESGLLDEVKDLGRELKEGWARRKEERETPPPPMTCPWCGKEMEGGYLFTGRDAIHFRRKRPGLLTVRGTGDLRLDNEGGFPTYKTAWHCPDCRKLAVDTTGIVPMGEWPELGQTPEQEKQQ